MSLSSRIEEFQTAVSGVVSKLGDIQSQSRSIPEAGVGDLSRKLANLLGELEDAQSRLKKSNQLLEEIQSKWSR